MSAGRRLRHYLRPHWSRFAWACAAMSAVSLLNGASVILLQPVVDRVFVARDMSALALTVAGLPLLAALKAVASYAQTYLMSWIGQRVVQRVREDVFGHLHALPLEFFSGRRAGEVLARVTHDLALVQTALTTLPVYLVRDTLTVVFLGVSLFWLDWRLALLSAAGSPLPLAAFYVLSRKMRRSSRQSQEAVDRLNRRLQDSVLAMSTVQAYGYEEGAAEKFREENAAFFTPMMRYLRATALQTPLAELGASLLLAAVVLLGGREVVRGLLTPGAFFAFLGALLALYAPIKNLARVNAEAQRAWAGAERILRLLDEPPASAAGPARGGTAFPGLREGVRFRGVGFRYPGAAAWALRGLSLELPRGARVAVVGPSGCGKSTLARLLLRLYEPAEGEILFDGRPAGEFSAASLRARVGLVEAEAAIFHETVLQNVALGRRTVTLGEVERACRACGADAFIGALPEGYQTVLGGPDVPLSSGQRQRIALARLLLKNPEIAVLDEATAHLDAPSEEEALASLESCLSGRTVLVISHRLAPLTRADRIYVLDGGAVAESGTHAQLLAARGLYRRLFEREAAERGQREAA